MLPGETVSFTLGAQTVAGAVAPSLTLSDLIVRGYLNGAVVSLAPALTYIEDSGVWSQYKLDVTLPAISSDAVSWFKALMQPDDPALYRLDRLGMEGEIEVADLTQLYDLAASPIVSVISAGGPVGDVSIRVVKGDYAVVSFTVRDQSGAAVDLSGWNNPQFGVKNEGQTGTAYLQTSGISMTAGGLVTIAIPETASFYAFLTTGVDSINLYFTFKADQASDTAKTSTIGRGPCLVLRSEV